MGSAPAQFDHRDWYIFEEERAAAGTVSQFDARCVATAAAVRIYRFPLRECVEAEDILMQLRNWSSVRDARLPRFVDCWIAEDLVWVVLAVPECHPLQSPEAHEALASSHRGYAVELALQTIEALAALHAKSLSHQNLTLQSYGVSIDGLAILRDHGMIARLEHMANMKPGDDNRSDFVLSSHSMAMDLADWALIVCGLILGRDLVSEFDQGLDPVQPDFVKQLSKDLNRSPEARMLAGYFEHCLQARASSTSYFDNAKDALGSFPAELRE